MFSLLSLSLAKTCGIPSELMPPVPVSKQLVVSAAGVTSQVRSAELGYANQQRKQPKQQQVRERERKRGSYN
jgi:hypothetical protein